PESCRREGARVRAFLDSPACALALARRYLAVVEHFGARCVYAHGDLETLLSLRTLLERVLARPRLARTRAQAALEDGDGGGEDDVLLGAAATGSAAAAEAAGGARRPKRRKR